MEGGLTVTMVTILKLTRWSKLGVAGKVQLY